MKISELLNIVKSGARSNKYRLHLPVSNGKDFDILCTTASLPGRNITPTEVWVKGKRAMISGETTWQSTWQLSFYNDENFIARYYFWIWMNIIHNPAEFSALNFENSDLFDFIGLSTGNDIYRDIKESISENFQIKNISDVTKNNYQKDLIIEQLDFNGDAIHSYRIIGAFPTNVDDVQLHDQEGDVSQTSVTISYSNIEILN